MTLADDAWEWFKRENGIGEDRFWERESFKTGYHRALEEAADAFRLDDQSWGAAMADPEQWLRDRAASVEDPLPTDPLALE